MEDETADTTVDEDGLPVTVMTLVQVAVPDQLDTGATTLVEAIDE